MNWRFIRFATSKVVPLPQKGSRIRLPGTDPASRHVSINVALNPIRLASWVGCLVTSLNLLPVGQLDGGHVVYAIFGRKLHSLIGRAIFVGMILLTAASYYFNGLLVYVLFIIILAVMIRAAHLPVYDEDEPLDLTRKIIALIGLVVFFLCFMTVPVSF